MSSTYPLAALSALDQPAFVAALAGVFEHSPWVAEEAWFRRPFADRQALYGALEAVLRNAGRERQLALIHAHPELAGKAAIRGELTEESAREQAGAGLNSCTPAEFGAIRRLNDAYREKFGWPFIVAVKGLTREDIIATMARRLEGDSDSEFAEALTQIMKIATFRLADLVTDAA